MVEINYNNVKTLVSAIFLSKLTIALSLNSPTK